MKTDDFTEEDMERGKKRLKEIITNVVLFFYGIFVYIVAILGTLFKKGKEKLQTNKWNEQLKQEIAEKDNNKIIEALQNGANIDEDSAEKLK